MIVIGIAGGSGSGKTTVVRKIIESLPPDSVAILSQDSYYKDNSHIPMEERKKINFDHPDAIEFELLAKHIKQLKKNQAVEEPTYSYITCERLEESRTVSPKKVIIVEGILILSQKILRDKFDIKVFVSADNDDRLSRIIQRDTVERGRTVEDVLQRYDAIVKPMHLEFIAPSMRYADIIMPQGGKNTVAIDVLTHFIHRKLDQ
ncbi:MAG: uridine kinase [Bacteroidales bacterium]|nr:uridine kinase [Bacteroidales bacterium]